MEEASERTTWTVQKYENGGATGCFAYFTIAALYDLGAAPEADADFVPNAQEYDQGGFEGRVPMSLNDGGCGMHTDGL